MQCRWNSLKPSLCHLTNSLSFHVAASQSSWGREEIWSGKLLIKPQVMFSIICVLWRKTATKTHTHVNWHTTNSVETRVQRGLPLRGNAFSGFRRWKAYDGLHSMKKILLHVSWGVLCACDITDVKSMLSPLIGIARTVRTGAVTL